MLKIYCTSVYETIDTPPGGLMVNDDGESLTQNFECSAWRLSRRHEAEPETRFDPGRSNVGEQISTLTRRTDAFQCESAWNVQLFQLDCVCVKTCRATTLTCWKRWTCQCDANWVWSWRVDELAETWSVWMKPVFWLVLQAAAGTPGRYRPPASWTRIESVLKNKSNQQPFISLSIYYQHINL